MVYQARESGSANPQISVNQATNAYNTVAASALTSTQRERLHAHLTGALQISEMTLPRSSTRSHSAPARGLPDASESASSTPALPNQQTALTNPQLQIPNRSWPVAAETRPNRRRLPPLETQQESKRMRLDGGMQLFVKTLNGDSYYQLLSTITYS